MEEKLERLNIRTGEDDVMRLQDAGVREAGVPQEGNKGRQIELVGDPLFRIILTVAIRAGDWWGRMLDAASKRIAGGPYKNLQFWIKKNNIFK